MDLTKLKNPLAIDQVDFRIQSINKGGYATILAYKDARVDMQRLDEVCTPLNWKREHTRDNQNCIVSIWDESKNQWVSKEDTGTESFTEKEKGLASDSFKRACFNWGIGSELYDYPVIQVKLNENEFEVKDGRAKQTWSLKLREWVWTSQFIDNELTHLSCEDENGIKRFTWEKGKNLPQPKAPKVEMITESQKTLITKLMDTATTVEGETLAGIKADMGGFTKQRAIECIDFLNKHQTI